MGARKTKDEFMDVEWAFDTYDELAKAAAKEARVCGDTLREAEDGSSFSIFNYHQNSVRWKGYLTPHAWECLKAKKTMRCKECDAGDKAGDAKTPCAIKKHFTVVLTNEEVAILKEGESWEQIRDVKYHVIEQIVEQAKRKE